MAVLLLTMLGTRAVAQDAAEMREQMGQKLAELKALAPANVKGLDKSLKEVIISPALSRYTELYNQSPLDTYSNYEDAYDDIVYIITRTNQYLTAYARFSDNMSQLKTLIDNFNADTEPKQEYKSAAQNVYDAYIVLSDNDMISLTEDDLDNLKEYMYDEYWIETQDVNEENMSSVYDPSTELGEYASTYEQFNGYFGRYFELLSAIYVTVDGTGTAASPENLTLQLKNPDLSTNEQWWGTDWAGLNSGFSAASQEANEFDTYQLVNLPEGYYTIIGYAVDRRDKWENLVDKDDSYEWDYRTALYAKVGEDDTMQVNTQYILPLTADITSGNGNIYSFEKAGVTYYAPNDLAQYRVWENAKAEIAGKGHAVVLNLWVYEDASFGKLGFVRRQTNGNCLALVDGMELYYAKDDFPRFTPASADVDDVTIGEDGWSTLYAADAALDFSGIQGLTAYTANLNGSTVTLTQVDNVPVGTGVMLKGEAKTTYRIPRIADSDTNKGYLIGSTQDTSYDEFAPSYGIFVFDNNEFKFVKKTEGVVAARTPYVVASNDFASLNIVLEGEATGIKDIEHSTLNIEHYYDLQGRRVNKPTKGVYIVDGKKVVVK